MAESGRVLGTHLFRARWVRRVESVARVIAVMSLIAAFDIALPDFHSTISRSDAAAIAATGLLVQLDAANTASYSGSGTTWTDLSGNAKTGTITTASLNAVSSTTPRSLATGAGKYASLASGFSDFSGGMTIQATVDLGTADNWERIMDFATDYNGGSFVAGDGDSSNNILFARAGTTSDLVLQFYAPRGSSPVYLGECRAAGVITSGYHNYAVTVTPTGGAPTCVIYVDGTAVTSTSSLTRMPDNVTRTANFLAHSNWTADTDLAGNYKSFLMYGRALSSSEIATNWTADRQSSAPSALSVGTTTQTSVALSWTAPTSAGISAITDYTVEYSTNNSTWNTFADGTSTSTSATVTGLAAGTLYYFRVSAVNASFTGIASSNATRSTNAAWVATFDSQGGSAVSAANWTSGASLTLGATPTRAGYTFTGWSTSATGSTLVYQTTTPSRSGNNIVYTTGYGKGAGDAAATLTNQGASFSRVRYRMEANYSGTLRWADVSFDKWAGATISSLAIPDLGDARTIKTNVSNMNVDSNWPGFAGAASAVTAGTGKSGRLELWPWDYTTTTTGILPAGDTNTYDSDDTSAGSAAYGSFQVHNLTDSQTVLAWNHHGVADVDLGFGNNLATTHTDWTFRGRTNFDSTTWKLQIFIGDTYAASASFVPSVNADTTYYAQWTPTVNTVTYNTQGGSSVGSASWATGTSLTLPAAPTRTGYTFAGWYDASTGGNLLGSAGSTYSPANTANFTVFAQWTGNTLTVTYNAQGGSSVANGSTISGGSIAASPGTPTRANYDFKGWFAASTGGSAITFPYAHGQLANFSLYAQWITNQSALSITNAPASLAYNGTVTVGTTGGSGTGSVSYATSTPGVCSINASSGLVTMLAPSGTCSISATKAADANYYAVTGNVDIAATQANQSALSVTGTNSGTYGGSISLSTTGGTTAGVVTWSAGSSTACSVDSAGTVSITSGTGTCSISATMAGNTNYLAVTSAGFSVTVNKATQGTVTVSTTSVTYGSTLALSATGGNGGGAITWQIILGTCTVSAGMLTPGDAGSTCVVRATKATDSNFLAKSSADTTISIARTAQATLSVTSTSATYGSTLALTAAGGSGAGLVTWSVISGTCTVSGSNLSPGDAGSACVVRATKAQDTNYLVQASPDTTVTIARAAQSTVTVTSTSVTFGATLSLTSSGGSGTGVVTWQVVLGTCTVSGTTLTPGDAGSTCQVRATKAQDTNYLLESSANTTVTIVRAAQSTLSVSSTSATYGSALTLTTTGGSGTGAVTWQVMLGTCTVSGNVLTPGNAASTCQVKATKAQDTNYLATNSVTTTVTINKANQTGLNITSASSFTTGSALSLTASGGQSSGSLSWAVTSGLCTLSGTSLTSPSRGGVSCTVEVTRAGDANYNAATDSMVVTVNKILQTLTFRTTAPTPANPGGTYTVSVDSDAFLAPVVAIANSSSSVCSISAGIVTFNSVGTCLVSATQVGNDTVLPASASQSITVTAVAAAAPASTLPAVTVPTVPATTPAPSTSSLVVTETTVALKAASVVTTTTVAPVVTTTTTTTTIPADPTKPQTDASGNYPELEAGDATAMVRGVAVKADVKHVDGTLVITLPNKVKVVFGASAKGSRSVGIGADGVLRMYRKDIVDVTATGLAPGTTYTVFMFSTPVELGRGEVQADGSVKASLQMPHDAAFGGHTVQINGVGPDNEVVTTQLGIEVLRKKRSTTTMVIVLLAAMALAMLSGRPILSNRRRRRA